MQNKLITINMRRYLVTQPRNKRARKAIRFLIDRVAHYTKTKPGNVRISMELNSLVIKRYSRSMNPIRVNVGIDNEIATVTQFVDRKAEPKTEAVKVAGKRPAEAKKEAKK
jgi:ribosomal protein L31E